MLSLPQLFEPAGQETCDERSQNMPDFCTVELRGVLLLIGAFFKSDVCAI